MILRQETLMLSFCKIYGSGALGSNTVSAIHFYYIQEMSSMSTDNFLQIKTETVQHYRSRSKAVNLILR